MGLHHAPGRLRASTPVLYRGSDIQLGSSCVRPLRGSEAAVNNGKDNLHYRFIEQFLL
jgi:hypothetical protein